MPTKHQLQFPPLAISCAALVKSGRDNTVRNVIQDLVDFSFRLAEIRETLARQAGLIERIGNAKDRRRLDLSPADKRKAAIEIAAPRHRAASDTPCSKFDTFDMRALGRFAQASLGPLLKDRAGPAVGTESRAWTGFCEAAHKVVVWGLIVA